MALNTGRKGTVQVRHIKELTPDPANRRRHNPRNIGMVVDALHQVGAARSIVIDEDDGILAGNGVTEAAAEAGSTKVRVIEARGDEIIAVRRRGLTAEQKRALAIYDNRTAELAEWDADQLQADLAAGLDLKPWFSDEELAKMTGTFQPVGEDDTVLDTAGSVDSQEGRMYTLGSHRLWCGDSRKPETIKALFQSGQPRLWIHDPPYDVPFGQWPLLPSIDVVAVWHRGKDAYHWMGETFVDDAWGVHNLVFTGGVRGQHNATLPCCLHDTVTVWRRTPCMLDGAVIRVCGCKATADDRPYSWQEHTGGVLTGAEGMSWGKPVLENAMVMAYVPAGAIVWDPCAGSGSSLLAAAQHGRIWRGAEAQPRWADLIRRRWTRWAKDRGLDPGLGALEAAGANNSRDAHVGHPAIRGVSTAVS
ncbi:MAG: hypothetical protein ABIF82_06425 [Planctomycetota bacterium]